MEYLQCRRWYRKLCLFYKIFKKNKPVYLFNLILTRKLNYDTRNTDKITPFHTKHSFFKNSFFPSTDPNLQSAASLSVFKKNLLKFIRPSPNSVFNCYNCKGIKYHTRLRQGLSHLREHKFKHSFQDTLNPFCFFVPVALMLKQIHIFFFTAPCLQIKDTSSWAQLMISIVLWQILMIRYWLLFFFLVEFL